MGKVGKFLKETTITEAEEIKFEELPEKKQKVALKFAKILNAIIESSFTGVHGTIISLTRNTDIVSNRIMKKTMEKLIKEKDFRWIDLNRNQISIGM